MQTIRSRCQVAPFWRLAKKAELPVLWCVPGLLLDYPSGLQKPVLCVVLELLALQH